MSYVHRTLAALATLLCISLTLTPATSDAQTLVPAASSQRAGQGHRLPTIGKVTKEFNPPPEAWLAGHRGVDIMAAVGTPIRASAAGTIHFAGPVGGRPVISIMHSNGIRTTYDPVIPQVRKGQHVKRGQVIGILAPENEFTHGPGLGWGAKIGDAYIDPLSLLGTSPVRLYP